MYNDNMPIWVEWTSFIISIVALILSGFGVFLTIRLSGKTERIQKELETKLISKASLEEYKKKKKDFCKAINEIISNYDNNKDIFNINNCKVSLSILVNRISALLIDERSDPFKTIKEDLGKINAVLFNETMVASDKNETIVKLLAHLLSFIEKPDIH